MTALLTEGCVKPHPFAEGCSPEFLNHLEEFATEVRFRKGEMILKEGDYADRFYLICEGKIALEADSDGKPGIFIQMLGPGEILGWSWLYPPFEWNFTARAVENSRTVMLNAASLLIRAEEDPVFGYELMKRMSRQLVRRLRTMRQRLIQEAKARKPSDYSR
jgi:CRP/FNR family cyclic AMP-dependent transcriptional regulator